MASKKKSALETYCDKQERRVNEERETRNLRVEGVAAAMSRDPGRNRRVHALYEDGHYAADTRFDARLKEIGKLRDLAPLVDAGIMHLREAMEIAERKRGEAEANIRRHYDLKEIDNFTKRQRARRDELHRLQDNIPCDADVDTLCKRVREIKEEEAIDTEAMRLRFGKR